MSLYCPLPYSFFEGVQQQNLTNLASRVFTPNPIQQPMNPKMGQDRFLALASQDLVPNLSNRFTGKGFSIRLCDLAPQDSEILLQIYKDLRSVYDMWLYMHGEIDEVFLQSYLVKNFLSDHFFTKIRQFGKQTALLLQDNASVSRVIHDVRGGALSSLVGLLSLLEEEPELTKLNQAVNLARDHAKLIRSCFPEIDETIYVIDERKRSHSITHFEKKWNNLSFRLGSHNIKVTVENTFDGSVSSCCLETSAIDRILYNLVNNAARFCKTPLIDMHMLPINEHTVRWVVCNDLREEQISWLNQHEDLRVLFRGGLTNGGNGIGLSSCAQLVATSMGMIDDTEDALDSGVIGAKLADKNFTIWFHWPIYHPSIGEPSACTC